MKLSQFRINKTLRFYDGKIEIITNDMSEIQFYNLTYDVLERINANVIQKLKGGETDEMLMYQIIPYICNCEVDISLEEFVTLAKVPPVELSYFLEAVVDAINNLFDSSEKLETVKKKINILNGKMPELQEQIKETPQQEYDKLMKLLPTIKDKEEKKFVFRRLAELNNLIGE